MRKCSILTPLVAAGTLLIPTAAWAQGAAGDMPAAAPADAPGTAPAETAQMEETPPPEAAPPPAEEPPAAASAEMSASTEMSAAEGMAAPTAEPPPAEPPAEEEDGGVPGWFRIDSDALTLQLWAGATHDVGGVGIATDIYVDSGYYGEFDIGVEVPLGEQVLLIPMAGIGFDWSAHKATTLVAPQLFGYFDFDPIYVEWWSQFFFTSLFADKGYVEGGGTEIKDTLPNFWYNRLFVLYNATENFSIGPQIEPTIALNDAAKVMDEDGNDKSLTSLPIGGRVNLGYGKNNTLGLFLGYETVKESRAVVSELDEAGEEVDTHEHGIVGRFTFVRTW